MYSGEVGCTRRRLDVLGGGWVYLEEVGCTRRRLGVLRGGWVYLQEVGCTRGRLGVLGGGWMYSEEVGCTWRRLDVLGGGWVFSERGNLVSSEHMMVLYRTSFVSRSCPPFHHLRWEKVHNLKYHDVIQKLSTLKGNVLYGV